MGFDPHQLVKSATQRQHSKFQSLKEKVLEAFYGKEQLEVQRNHMYPLLTFRYKKCTI